MSRYRSVPVSTTTSGEAGNRCRNRTIEAWLRRACRAIMNPVLWELGHVAWFQEHWCLRLRADESLSESILDGADALYDSAKVAHDTRWDLPLPDPSATLEFQDRVLDRVLARLEREPDNEWFLYFVQLALFHEDMHAEAFHYTRQTLGYADPLDRDNAGKGALDGDVELPGGEFLLGAARNSGFHFEDRKSTRLNS